MKTIDLNCDLGESFGAYTNLMQMDSLILPHITSANIACGFHAGDPVVIKKTVELAVKNGVALGAHPGLPDLQGFGRRNMKITPEEAESLVIYQVGALQAFAHSAGTELNHVKPHGALYNMAATDFELAKAIARGIKKCSSDLIFVCLYGSCMVQAAEDENIKYACEVFADRAYQENGLLVPRSQPGAVITDETEAIARSIKMVTESKVTSITGKEISVQADTICVHGDNPKAVEFVKSIHAEFVNQGIEVKSIR